MGWITFMTSIVVVPIFVVHSAFQIIISTRVNGNNKMITIISVASNFLFVVASVLMPDGGDAVSGYSVFSLIKDSPDYFESVAMAAFALAVFISILAFCMSILFHRRLKVRGSAEGTSS